NDANIVEVAHAIKERIADLKTRLPGDIQVEVMQDRSIFIEASIQDLVSNMVLGALLTALVLYLFLHSIRGVIIAGVSIPTSVIATFNLIRYAGFTINFFSLMALAISVGILVTNAIVVLENVQRHIEHNDDPVTSSKVGTREIAIAVFASTLTNIVVFTPIALMKGIIGQFFIQFGLTVTFATIFSLITAFTLTPMLSARLLKKTEPKDNFLARMAAGFERFYNNLALGYRELVQKSLQRRILTIAAITVIFFGTIIGFGRYMGFGFFVTADQGLFAIKVEMPAGTNLTQTDEALRRIEAVLEKHRDTIKKVYTVLGKITGSAATGGNEGVDVAEITVDIGDKEERSVGVKEFYESLRKELALQVPSATFSLRENSPAGGGDAPVQLQITGTDLDKLVDIADQAEAILRSTPSLVDVNSSWEAGKPEIQIRPRRDLISQYGLSVTQVALAIRYGFEGQVATQYRVGDDEYDIRVRFNDADKNNIASLDKVSFVTAAGRVPLSALCDISEGSGPTQINRKDKKRMITLTAGIGDYT
ncbi:MAG TPA: efflux RND transporter permease subunit, partial [Calditrichia bacterium]|nr:efflux RND transporter permease subunit [Calditrichia bacterium]